MTKAEIPKTAAQMGIMQGSPPPRMIDIEQWDKGPDNRWAFQHISEIVPVAIPQRKGPDKIIDTDEHPRPGLTMEALAKLRPTFKKDGGTVTAGNASGINDGAAAVILISGKKANELGIEPWHNQPVHVNLHVNLQ